MAKKSQVVRVYFMDDSSKAFAITPDTNAIEFRQQVIKRIDLKVDDCFSIFEKKDQWERCLDAEEKPAELMKEWDMDEKKDEKFIFKKRIFLKEDDKEMQDPVAKDLVYIQAVNDVITCQYNVSLEEALKLSGLQVQVVYGDHNPSTHIKGFLTNNKDIANFIPKSLFSTKKPPEWEALILKEHAKHKSLSQEDAKTQYLNICKSFPLWGTTFYPPCKSIGNKNLPGRVIIGVNFEGIRLLKVKTKEIISEHLYTEICSWASSSGTFGFEFGNQNDSQKYTFETKQGAIIASTVQTYIDILVDLLKNEEPEEDN